MTEAILASIPSPSQGVWHLGPFPVRAYALCIVAGIIAALVIGDRRWAARGGERGVIYDIALWAVPFGLVGGRLYHVITDWPTYFGTPTGAGFLGALRIWDGGLGIWGAVALGGVGAWIGCRLRGIPLPAFGDAIAPGIILAQAIGRLGNYFNQELYGRETDLPWGLIIYDRVDANGQRDMLNGVSTGEQLFPHAVHPTFLYELLWNLLVFGVLLWADRRFRLGHGRLFALYVAGYCLGRFWIELMRSDHASLIMGIRVNTFTSMFVFIGAVIYIMAATKGREDPESLRGKDRDDDDDAESWIDEIAGEESVLAGAAAKTGVAATGAAGTLAASDAPPTDDVDEPAADAEVEQAEEPGSEVDEPVEDTPVEIEAEAAEPEPEPEPEPAIGEVEPDEVAAAVADAPEVHDAAVETADETEALAEDVAAVDEPETPAEEAEAEAKSEADETVEESAEDTPADDEPDADHGEPEPEPERAIGDVEPDEVAAAVADAPELHDAAEEAADETEALAEHVADAEAATVEESAEDTPADDESDADNGEPEPEPEPAIGDVEPDEVAAAVADAPEVHDAAVEAEAEAAEDAAESADPADQPVATVESTGPTAQKPRKRWWQRRS